MISQNSAQEALKLRADRDRLMEEVFKWHGMVTLQEESRRLRADLAMKTEDVNNLRAELNKLMERVAAWDRMNEVCDHIRSRTLKLCCQRHRNVNLARVEEVDSCGTLRSVGSQVAEVAEGRRPLPSSLPSSVGIFALL